MCRKTRGGKGSKVCEECGECEESGECGVTTVCGEKSGKTEFDPSSTSKDSPPWV